MGIESTERVALIPNDAQGLDFCSQTVIDLKDTESDNSNSIVLRPVKTGTNDNDSKFTLDQMISLRSPLAREWIARQRDSIKPWNQFFDQEKFAKPSSPNEITARITKNIKYFQANYLLLVLILTGYCLITSPLLLIAIAAFFGVHHVIGGQKGIAYQQKIFGRELTETHQNIIASCISVPLFLLAGATGVIFWIFGASAVLVGAHGACRLPEANPDEVDTFLQETA